MSILTAAQFKNFFPTVSPKNRELYLPFINLAMARFNINTERRVAMFCAQLAHESNNLTRWVENLNYSAHRLTEVWRKRFPTLEAARPYANNPKGLAVKTYGGRMGNRAGTDDGWTYRGRAPIQATGREMYRTLTNAFGREDFAADFVAHPDLLLQPFFGFLASAAIFAAVKKCNPLADENKIVECTKAINGGTNGLAERKANYERFLRFLPDDFRLSSYSQMKLQFETAQATVSDPTAPLMKNGSFDFQNDYDVSKDDAPDAFDSGDEFKKTSGSGIVAPPDDFTGDNQNGDDAASHPPPAPREDDHASMTYTNQSVENGLTAAKPSDASDTSATAAATAKICKERPSTFIRWFTAVKSAVGYVIAAIGSWFGYDDFKEILRERAGNLDGAAVEVIVLILLKTAVVVGAGVFLVWLASKAYDRAANRANALNMQKLVGAQDRNLQTTDFKS